MCLSLVKAFQLIQSPFIVSINSILSINISINSIKIHLFPSRTYDKKQGKLSMWTRVLPRKCTVHNKHPLPTTQEKTLHMDITRWSTPKSDWLHSLQPKMEKLYTVSKNKTRRWGLVTEERSIWGKTQIYIYWKDIYHLNKCPLSINNVLIKC